MNIKIEEQNGKFRVTSDDKGLELLLVSRSEPEDALTYFYRSAKAMLASSRHGEEK